MTAKTIVNISFSEIATIEITCSKCGAGIKLPIVKEKPETHFPPFHYQCFGCHETLWNGENDQRLMRIVGMLRCLGMWQALDKPGFDISFSMDMQ